MRFRPLKTGLVSNNGLNIENTGTGNVRFRPLKTGLVSNLFTRRDYLWKTNVSVP